MISSQTASSTTSRSGRRKIAIQILAIAVGAMTAVTSAWAVFVRQDGNTLRAQNEKYQPLANQTATISLGGVTKTVTTRDDGTFCIKTEQNATEEERSAPYCAIFPGGGSGTITIGGYSAPFSLGPSGALSISTWQKLSNTEIGGIAAAAALGVYALTKDNNDNNASSTGGGSSGGTTNTQPSTPPSTPGNNYSQCEGQLSANYTLTNSQGGCPGVASGGHACNLSAVGSGWLLDCGANTGSVIGSLNTATGLYTAQGSGSYSAAANANFHYELTFSLSTGCSFAGLMYVDNLLSPSERCDYSITGVTVSGGP